MTSFSTFSTLARAARLGSTRKRGVTLIEAVLYISIALALIVGGLVFFQQASLAQRTNSAVRNISAIASETRALFQGQTSFADFLPSTLINAGAVPTSLIDTTTTPHSLKNEWDGTITAGPTAAVNGRDFNGPRFFPANSGFFVVYTNVPNAACARLTNLDRLGNGPFGSGIRSITFGTGTPIYPAVGSKGIPLELLDAGFHCKQAAVNGLVTVRIDFER
jgi:type II secretory pathway pseudopilin PulG